MADYQNALFNTHERGEVRARASTVDAAISTYNRDLLAQIAFDAADVGTNLSKYLTNDLGASDSEASPIVEESVAVAAPFLVHAGQRVAIVPADTAQSEKTFYQGWSKFYGKWKLFFTRIQSFSLLGPSPDDAWNMLMQFETDFAAWKKQGETLLHVKSTAPDIPALPQPDPGAVEKFGSSVQSVAKTVLLYGALAGGGFLLYKYLSSRVEERNIGLGERRAGGSMGGSMIGSAEPYGYLPSGRR